MQLYFVRHGESEANVRQVFSNSDRDTAFGLTDVGRAQVEDLAGRLAGVPFAAFYCSPVLRARQSADIVSARLGIDYVVTPAIASLPPGPVLLLGHGGTFHCMLPIIVSNVTFDLVVQHGMGHTSVVIAEQRAHGLACVHWDAADPPGLS